MKSPWADVAAEADEANVAAASTQAMTMTNVARARMRVPYPGSAEDKLGCGADRPRVARDQERGHDRLAPGLEVVADLLLRTDQRQLLDQLLGDGRSGVVLLPGQVELLDRVDQLFVAHPDGDVGVEVLALGAHATEVEGIERAQHVGGPLHVVVDDQRHGRDNLEVVERAPRTLAGEALAESLLVEVLVARREEHREPAVAQLRR